MSFKKVSNSALLLALFLSAGVAQAAGVNVAAGDVNGDGTADAKSASGQIRTNEATQSRHIKRAVLSVRKAGGDQQESAQKPNNLQAAQPKPSALLLPAVQSAREAAKRTEKPSASSTPANVKAPDQKPGIGLLLPAVQK